MIMNKYKFPIYILSNIAIFSLAACSNNPKNKTANKKVVFDNCAFTVNGDSPSEDFEEKFKGLFVTEEVGCILDSFEQTKLNIDNQIGTTTLRLGTQKVGGSLNLNFKYDIKEIILNTQSYCKSYTGGFSVDQNSILNVYSDESLISTIDMTLTEQVISESVETVLFFKNPIKNIKLEAPNAGGRVLIHSLDISFEYKA